MLLKTPRGVKMFCVFCLRIVRCICGGSCVVTCVWPPKLKVETCTHTNTHTQTQRVGRHERRVERSNQDNPTYRKGTKIPDATKHGYPIVRAKPNEEKGKETEGRYACLMRLMFFDSVFCMTG
uniref:Putative secreted protein n=1 Tax=Anopheles triannulatus TaxID=58253 RepID=A0A2M4B4S8_9DIPT